MADQWHSNGRTLHLNGRLAGMVDTDDQADQIVRALNQRSEAWLLYQAARTALKFTSPLAAWNGDGSPQNNAARAVLELRSTIEAFHKKMLI